MFAEVLQPAGEEWMNGMSREKRARVMRMRRKTDAWAAVTAHRLLCYALAGTTGFVPKPDDWDAGEFGKPYLKNTNIHFNISHSGSMAMCALHDSPVGADIEMIKPYSDAVARRIMSDEEMQRFQSSADRQALFFKIWTLKEAYLKFTGTGISALGSITVYPADKGIIANAKDCCFSLIDVPGYQAAVCADTAVFTAEHVESGALLRL